MNGKKAKKLKKFHDKMASLSDQKTSYRRVKSAFSKLDINKKNRVMKDVNNTI